MEPFQSVEVYKINDTDHFGVKTMIISLDPTLKGDIGPFITFKLFELAQRNCTQMANVTVTTSIKYLEIDHVLFLQTCLDNKLISTFVLFSTEMLNQHMVSEYFLPKLKQMIKNQENIIYEKLMFSYDYPLRSLNTTYIDPYKWQCYFNMTLPIINETENFVKPTYKAKIILKMDHVSIILVTLIACLFLFCVLLNYILMLWFRVNV